MSNVHILSNQELLKQSLPQARLQLTRELGLKSNVLQDSFILSPERFKVFRASRRVGKSFTSAKDVLLDFFMPGTRGWVVGPTYELSFKEFRYIADFYDVAMKKWKLPPLEMRRENWRGGDLYLRTAWGSEVLGKSADNPASLVGEELDWVILAEAAQLTADVWHRRIFPCLTTRKGRAIFATTPDRKGRWLYELEKAALHPDNVHDWKVIICAAWEAPHIDKDEIERARINLPPEIFNEQFGGEWCFLGGLVYPTWDGSIIIKPFPIPPTWPFVVGLDFGAVTTAGMFIAKSIDGSFYAFDEHYVGGISTAMHGQRIRSKLDGYSGRCLGTIADWHGLGTQLMRDLKGTLTPMYSCGKAIQERRDIMLQLLHTKKFFVFERCVNLIREISTACYNKSGNIVGDDHAIDATEYAIEWMYRKSGGPVVRRNKPLESDLAGYNIVFGRYKEELS